MKFLGILILAGFLAVVSGCSDKITNPLAPYQPEIANVVDNFQLQATAMKDVTFSEDYLWHNSSDSATINQSVSAETSGKLTLVILDSLGTEVYSHDLMANGTFGSVMRGPAEPGLWTLQVRFTNVTGTVNFRVQKAN
jgi:hypothetical protein